MFFFQEAYRYFLCANTVRPAAAPLLLRCCRGVKHTNFTFIKCVYAPQLSPALLRNVGQKTSYCMKLQLNKLWCDIFLTIAQLHISTLYSGWLLVLLCSRYRLHSGISSPEVERFLHSRYHCHLLRIRVIRTGSETVSRTKCAENRQVTNTRRYKLVCQQPWQCNRQHDSLMSC